MLRTAEPMSIGKIEQKQTISNIEANYSISPEAYSNDFVMPIQYNDINERGYL